MAEEGPSTLHRPAAAEEVHPALLLESILSYLICMLDPHGRIVSWNGGAQRILGYAAEEILDQNFCLFFTQEDCGRGVPSRALNLARTTGRYETETWGVRKDGGRIWAHIVVEPVHDVEGEIAGFALVAQDFSERREAQLLTERTREERTQAYKSETVSQLASGIAHDFNDLIMVVSGQAERLRTWLTDPAALSSVQAIERAMDHGQVLTQQLLEFSRRRPSAPIIVDVAQRIANIRGMLGAALRGNITFVCDIAGDIWPVVVDAAQFELAVLNVALAARDAMPRGGVFSLTARNSSAATLDNDLVGDFIELTMSDTGESISDQFRALLASGGSGTESLLGLAQARRFVQQSGGIMQIKPKDTGGTQVVIYLPRSRGPMTDLDLGSENEPPTQRVLLVEDNKDVAEVTQAMLEGLGYQVRCVPDAIEAMEVLQSNKDFDVVLSDIIMSGGMSGIELANVIRSTFPDLPCVLMSAYGDAGQEASYDFPILRKPFKSAMLREALANIQHMDAA